MKGEGKHPDKALTAVQVRNANRAGRYADGNGLYLVVDPSGAKRWLLRIVVQGRRRDIGLGGVSVVGLAEARERALEYRRIARDGRDPLLEKRQAKAQPPTFREAAEMTHRSQEAGWKNDKHAQQWINTLKQYVYPEIGNRRVDQIGTPEVLKVLAPIWLEKPETARRVRQRLGVVLDWAKAAGHRTGDNPVHGVTKGLPKQTGQVQHHRALPFKEVAGFMKLLREGSESSVGKLAFEFLILTASRTSEVLLARWSEFELEKALWTVPAARMKAGREHRVPLSDRSLVLLKHAKLLSGTSPYVFPGRDPQKPLSNMVFAQTLKRMKVEVTAHGFRSTFRDWAAEATAFPRELAEMALAHTIENKVEAAYRRGDLLEKRSKMMQEWTDFTQHGIERFHGSVGRTHRD